MAISFLHFQLLVDLLVLVLEQPGQILFELLLVRLQNG